MNVARLSDGLLPASSTASLISLLSEQSDGVPIDDVVRDLSVQAPLSRSRARNTIAKLMEYQIIRKVEPLSIALTEDVEGDWHDRVVRRIAADVVMVLNKANAWSCLKLEPNSGALIIDAMTLPAMADGLGMWVTDFGVARRATVQTRFWTIADEHCKLFIAGVREANSHSARCARTAEQLASDAQLVAEGEAAEIWVLEFEKKRLEGHPLRDQIRRVVKEDVWAGYNIASFASLRSLQHDLFIAVKIYNGVKSFHWTRNEIITAIEFEEAYALYLVDGAAFGQPGYVPNMIRGPNPDMFALSGSGWRVEPTSFDNVLVQAGSLD